MMTEAPDMNPAMTEWLRKLVSQPSLNRPTKVYMQPARKATCHMLQPDQTRAPADCLQDSDIRMAGSGCSDTISILQEYPTLLTFSKGSIKHIS